MSREAMNRQQRRAHAKDMARLPAALKPVPRAMWPKEHALAHRLEVWLSRFYLVQLFQEPNDVLRLSINRVTVKAGGRWEDNLTWDELQEIKAQVGYRDAYAVEVYPPAADEVNVANMRHLWILPEPLDIGWRAADASKRPTRKEG